MQHRLLLTRDRLNEQLTAWRRETIHEGPAKKLRHAGKQAARCWETGCAKQENRLRGAEGTGCAEQGNKLHFANQGKRLREGWKQAARSRE